MTILIIVACLLIFFILEFLERKGHPVEKMFTQVVWILLFLAGVIANCLVHSYLIASICFACLALHIPRFHKYMKALYPLKVGK